MPDSGFAPVSYERWAAAVAADLGPDALDRRLRTVTEDGIVLDALHTPGTAGPGAGVGHAMAALLAEARRARGRQGWLVRQRLDASTLTLADLRDEIAGGADSVALDVARVEPLGVAARVGALAGPTWKAGAELALAGIHDAESLLGILSLSPDAGALSLGFDPLGTWARRGAPGAPAQSMSGLAGLRPWLDAPAPVSVLRASGEPWHDAGATAAWTLACIVATALEYVRRLDALGTDAALALRGIELVLPLGTDVFEGISSVRALRLVWSRILEEIGVGASRPPRVVVAFGSRGLAR
ncbi:MAG TPA: methylmalonyl-CoA mutase family protein, partial [Gemmatimonadales bacterium]|nr:methylmalonyl-CoA mutase family protein [Gemmatimonadales bacterium]